MSVGYVYDYAKQGLLTNLQPYFNRDMNPKDFFMEPFKAMRYPSMETGDLYAIPFAFTLTSLYYNKGMFDSSALAYPTEAWSWDTLRQASKRLVRDKNGDGKTDIFGFISQNTYTIFDPLVHAFGGSILNNDLTKVTLDSPPGVKAAEFLTDMIYKDGSASNGALALFTKQQAALAVMTTLELDYERQQGFDFDVTLVPQGPAKRVIRLWPNSFSIPINSDQKEAAWRFIKYVVSRTEMDRYSGERQVPVNRKLALSKDWLRPNLMGNKMVFVNSIQYGDALEFRPNWGKWDAVLRKELAPAWTGTVAASTAVKKAADAIQVVIDEANKVR
jgi:multiple sugar transport system substrate-binding protein